MKFGFVVSAVLSLFAIQSFAANGTMKGAGSAKNPFQIEDYEDLKAIGTGVYLYSSDYVLTKDIDASASMNEMCNADGCNGFIPIGKNKDAADSIIFWGNIDGQNHTISNLNLWLPCERDVAFIAYLGGSVSNLNFDHVNVTGRVSESNYVATVAAKSVGKIRNVKVTNGFVQGQNYVGGIVGHATKEYNEGATIVNASFQGTIKGSQRVGGIVGQLDMDLDSAFVDAEIIALKKDVGGIVGYLTGAVRRTRSTGSIIPGMPDVDDVGGVAGYSKGGVYSCVSLMNLISYGYTFDDDIGGIVGDNAKGAVLLEVVRVVVAGGVGHTDVGALLVGAEPRAVHGVDPVDGGRGIHLAAEDPYVQHVGGLVAVVDDVEPYVLELPVVVRVPQVGAVLHGESVSHLRGGVFDETREAAYDVAHLVGILDGVQAAVQAGCVLARAKREGDPLPAGIKGYEDVAVVDAEV